MTYDLERLIDLLRQYKAVSAQSAKVSAAREALPAGSSRAKVTTANARWARAAEERERLFEVITHQLKECGFIPWGKNELNGGVNNMISKALMIEEDNNLDVIEFLQSCGMNGNFVSPYQYGERGVIIYGPRFQEYLAKEGDWLIHNNSDGFSVVRPFYTNGQYITKESPTDD
jgi:hypothetical protein